MKSFKFCRWMFSRVCLLEYLSFTAKSSFVPCKPVWPDRGSFVSMLSDCMLSGSFMLTFDYSGELQGMSCRDCDVNWHVLT